MTALSRKLGWGSIRSHFEILRKRSCNRFPLCNRVELMRVVGEGRATSNEVPRETSTERAGKNISLRPRDHKKLTLCMDVLFF